MADHRAEAQVLGVVVLAERERVVRHAAALAVDESVGSPADLDAHHHDGAVPRAVGTSGVLSGDCAAPGLRAGRQHRGLPRRGRRGRRTAAARASGTPSPPALGAIADGSNGDVAADAYHRVEEDLDLLSGSGSAATASRCRGRGCSRSARGEVNAGRPRPLRPARRRAPRRGIAPMVTLYHSDLPQPLEDDGGWLNPDTVERFAEYAELVGGRLADRVAHWVPVASPNAVTMLGYASASTRPGARSRSTRCPSPTTCSSPTAAARSRCATPAPAASAAPTTTPRCGRRPRSPPTSAPPSSSTRCGTGSTSSRCCSAATPSTCQPLLDDDFVRPGDLAMIRQPLDFYGVGYSGPFRVGGRARGRRRAVRDARPARPPHHRQRPADRARRAARVADHVPRPLPRRAAADRGHRVRRRLRRRRRPRRRGRRRRSGSTSSTGTSRRWRTPPSAASTSAASTCGACSTGSAGPTATPTATASCTSTAETQDRTPKSSYRWFADQVAQQTKSLG